MFTLPFLAASLVYAVSVALAKPTLTSCDISTATIALPPGQTGLAQPTATPSFIAIAVGVQNYTCSSAGTFTSVGAVAELADISCLFGTPAFATAQDNYFVLWSGLPISATEFVSNIPVGGSVPSRLGQHYFITNPITGTGLSPKWDFTSTGATKGNRNAFVVGARSGGIPSPAGSQNVDWLSLNGVQGALASQIFRVDTRGGQPPASCRPGTSISVKYTSKYWLLGGSIHH